MILQDFEKELKKEFGDKVSIVPHPTNEDMAGVYIENMFVCGCPSNNIYEERKSSYVNKQGLKHASTEDVKVKIARFFYRLENEKDFRELMTMDLDK